MGGATSGISARLQALWNGWKRAARWIADQQARILLTVFYYVILVPFALVLRWRSDPLAIKPGTVKGWRTRNEPEGTPLEQARRQF